MGRRKKKRVILAAGIPAAAVASNDRCVPSFQVGLNSMLQCVALCARRAAAAAGSEFKREDVAALPVSAYVASPAPAGEAGYAICLSEFADGERIRELPVCGIRMRGKDRVPARERRAGSVVAVGSGDLPISVGRWHRCPEQSDPYLSRCRMPPSRTGGPHAKGT
ncbi:unnamed protein product [Urochloa humidicola]